MPRLNLPGEIAQGLGICWLDAETQIAQREIAPNVWNICTRRGGGAWTPIAARGCNFLAAGGGAWLAYIPGVGVFGSDGVPSARQGLPAGLDGRGAASFDGAIAVSEDASSNIGLLLMGGDRTIYAHVPGASLTDKICVVSRTQALWIDQAGRPQTWNLPIPQLLPGPCLWPRVLRLQDAWWICYHSTDARGVVLHPFDSLDGYALTKPPAFYLDAVALSASRARVVWAHDAAEATIGLANVDVATDPRISLGQPVSVPIPAPQPIPTPIPPKEPTSPMPIAPNQLATVRAVFAAHPEINPMTDGERGQLTTLVVQALGGYPWGRKEKIRGSGILSDDALCYSVGGSSFEIYDIISGTDGAAGWDYKGTFKDGENGYFYTVPAGTRPVPVPTPAPGVDLSGLIARLAFLEGAASSMAARLAELEAAEADALDQIHQLDATTVKVGALTDYAKKGDRVAVSGRISFTGLNRWGGEIVR